MTVITIKPVGKLASQPICSNGATVFLMADRTPPGFLPLPGGVSFMATGNEAVIQLLDPYDPVLSHSGTGR